MTIARGFNHVSFPVQDLERSLRFYCDVLGLEPIPRPAFPFAGAWLRAGDLQVHLIVPPPGTPVGEPPPALNPLAGHVAVAIDAYAPVVEALKARSLDVLEGGEAQGQLWVRDPDGHLIELIVAPVTA
jgi:catechol 2,3-dioxygenase-like lactoylglutathione lyase family enzyme